MTGIPNLGEVSNKPQEEPKPDNGKEVPQTDFKIAEIWLRDGRLVIDAPPQFWQDRCRALGVLDYCKDIVKEARMESKSRIIPAKGNMMNFARGIFNKKKR